MFDFWNRRSRRGKIVLVVVGGLIVFSIIGALSDSGEETNTVARETATAPRDTTTSQEEAPSDSPEEAEDGACLSVPGELVRGIEEGLDTFGDGTLRNARAVKSDDPEGYLISADIQAPGLLGDDDIATWSRTGSEINSGLLFAVDGLARELSDWGADINEGSPAADLRDAFHNSPAFQRFA